VSALAEQQQALLQALWAARPDEAAASLRGHLVFDGAPAWQRSVRGLRAYRSNGRELAQRALAAAYPGVARLLGDAHFGPLARSLWLAHPPERGDVAQWGGGLPAHIEHLAELAEAEPHLADLARVEWALHRIATAPDGAADPASFVLLAQHDPALLALRLAPATACIESRWPVASLHAALSDADAAALDRCWEQPGETALVWRDGLRPRVRPAHPGEPAFIAALQDRRSLLDSLEAAPGLDLARWLAEAAQTGLLLAAEPL
jgi:hypothetical protein